MNSRFLLALLFSAMLGLRAFADEPAKDEAAQPKQASKEEIEARLAEHHRRREAQTASDQAAIAKAEEEAKAAAAATAAPVAKDPAAKTTATATNDTAAKEAPKVLPKVEVRKERITELDIQLQKQNTEIAREKANAKPTVLDETLNGPGISKALALFGGQSSEDRANVAKERVAMMEDEKDVIEAISQARTKEEKAELEKLLALMRETRRELEKTLR